VEWKGLPREEASWVLYTAGPCGKGEALTARNNGSFPCEQAMADNKKKLTSKIQGELNCGLRDTNPLASREKSWNFLETPAIMGGRK